VVSKIKLINNVKNLILNWEQNSQAVLKALKNVKSNSKTIVECKKNLKMACERNLINLIWIPGHEGFEGNERADELAKKGAKTTDIMRQDTSYISLGQIKQEIKTWTTKQTNLNWKNYSEGRHAKAMMPEISERKSENLLNLSRNQLRTVISFMTGHGRFRQFLHRANLATTSTCKFCTETETAEHIMTECDAYAHIRRKHLNKPYCTLQDYANSDIETLRKIFDDFTLRMWTPAIS